MHLSGRNLIASYVLALIVTGSMIGKVSAHTFQTQASVSSKPIPHGSTDVVAHLSPEEVEEGKLNEAYESVAEQQRKGSCTADIVERYKSEVIPLAEKAAFNVPKNKFLFLANRDIGNCYFAQQKFVEAEALFQNILQYAPVWPGTDDSAYPINFRQIATAQMGQQRWEAAEKSLERSVSLFDPQIERATKSNSEFSRTGHAGNLRGSKAISLAYLGIVYMREGRTAEALKTVESAFFEANQPNVSPTSISSVVKIGRSIAQASGDKDAIEKWSQRS